jgi:hypothetical protein
MLMVIEGAQWFGLAWLACVSGSMLKQIEGQDGIFGASNTYLLT